MEIHAYQLSFLLLSTFRFSHLLILHRQHSICLLCFIYISASKTSELNIFLFIDIWSLPFIFQHYSLDILMALVLGF